MRTALQHPALAAIVICPSNPFVSIDPILAVPELKDLLRARKVPVVAVSPIIDGAAVKGPAAKMMRELGKPVLVTTIAAHYRNLADGIVIDAADAETCGADRDRGDGGASRADTHAFADGSAGFGP